MAGNLLISGLVLVVITPSILYKEKIIENPLNDCDNNVFRNTFAKPTLVRFYR